MKNADLPAMPNSNTETYPFPCPLQWSYGLTKREHFAGLAMQGLLSNSGGVIQQNSMSGFGWCNTNPKGMADLALSCADALLAELDK